MIYLEKGYYYKMINDWYSITHGKKYYITKYKYLLYIPYIQMYFNLQANNILIYKQIIFQFTYKKFGLLQHGNLPNKKVHKYL